MANIIIGTGGLKRSLGDRAKVTADVLAAWWEYDKKAAKDFMNYIHEITKVQHNSGEWKSGKGRLVCQLPDLLFHSLKRSFAKFLPDEPGWGVGDCGDDDLRILYNLAPKLQGTRKRRRRM